MIKEIKIEKEDIKIIAVFFIIYVGIFLSLAFSYYIKFSFWKEGEVAQKDIVAPKVLQLKPQISESQVGIGKDVLYIRERDFEEFLNTVDQYLARYGEKNAKDIISPDRLDKVKTIVTELLLDAFNNVKDSKDLDKILDVFYTNLEHVTDLTSQEKGNIREIIKEISKKFSVKNEKLVLNTSYKKTFIKPGDVIIERGEKITKKDIQIFRKLKVKKKNISYLNYISLFFLSFLIYIFLYLYFIFFKSDILKDKRRIFLILSMLFLGTLSGVFVLPISIYIIPVAFFSIIVTISTNTNIGFAYTLTLTLLLGLSVDKNLSNFFIFTLVLGIASVFLMRIPKDRSVFTRASIILGILGFLLVTSLDIYKFHFSILTIRNSFIGFVSGALSSILVLGILPIIEGLFGIATSIKLLELSDPGQPLLKRLLEEAPGTYQHSAIVSNLAVAAASMIGADPLLARAGGFYHDIGKLKRPHFFVENQFSEKNIHDEIQPTLSTLAIISHVKDGVELGKKYNLPKEIIDIIKQHHGTSLVWYFYSRAIEKPSEKDGLTEEDFRYPGPKPQTKEAAIVMLADAIEAASRTITNPTPTKIKTFIESIFNKIIKDGQLEESPLTFRDLNMIKEAFEKFLLSMFHSRIEYPKIKQKE